MKISGTHEAWHQEGHVAATDAWYKLSRREIRKAYEGHNEVLLFLENKSFISRI